MKRQHEAPRILVVEDEADVAGFMCAVLQDEGYSVRVHRTGDCLDVINNYCPDVILCDYHLPHADGATVLKRFRTGSPCDARFVFVSAAPCVATQWRTWGADDCLAKPFDIDRLISVVERALGSDASVWSQPRNLPQGEQAS